MYSFLVGGIACIAEWGEVQTERCTKKFGTSKERADEMRECSNDKSS
jgi:hypothetical protein